MTQKQTTIFGLVTLVAVLAAVWLLFGKAAETPNADLRDRLLFPDLADRLNTVAAIRIEQSNSATTLQRDGTRWSIAEKAGYKADPVKVRELLVALLDAEIRQVKTDNPDLYDRIGLGEGATRVELQDEAGEAFITLAAGKRQFQRETFLSFVRPGDQARSYLVDSLPEIKAEASTWLPDTILEIARPRIASVTVEHPEDPTVTVRRESPEAEFALADIREDEQYIGYQPAGRLATAFSTLRIDDVRPAGEVDFGSPMAIARLKTFDGLGVRMRLFATGDEIGDAWLALAAEYALPAGEDGPERMPEAPADGEAEAEDINTRSEGWLFRIPSPKVGAVTRKREELVEPKPEEDTAAEGEEDGGT